MFIPFANMATKSGGDGFSYFLDDYSGASRAYSLRKLSSTYTGDAIEVRRDSDDTTQNIGFVDNVLDTGSLLTFVGAGSGYVKTWYNQDGSGTNNAVNTATGFQPVIVSSGSLITDNGKPAIDFGIANDDTLIFSNFTPSTIILIARSYGASGILNYALGSNTGGIGLDGTYNGDGITPDTIFAWDGSTPALATSVSGRTQTIFQLYADTAVDSGSIYLENSLEANDGGYTPIGLTNIGNRGGSSFALSGSIQEVIMYSTDESSTQRGQYTNLVDYYYHDTLYPLDVYSDAEIAVSFRRLRSDYTGNVVRLRRTYDGAEQDFGFASGSDYLNTASADAFCAVGGGVCNISAWYNQVSGSSGDMTENSYRPAFQSAQDVSFRTATFNGSDTHFSTPTITATTESAEYLVVDTEGISGDFDGIYTLASADTTFPHREYPRGIQLANISGGGNAGGNIGIAIATTSSVNISATNFPADTTQIFAYSNDGTTMTAVHNNNVASASYTGGTPIATEDTMANYGLAFPSGIGEYTDGRHLEYIRWNRKIGGIDSLPNLVNQYYNLY